MRVDRYETKKEAFGHTVALLGSRCDIAHSPSFQVTSPRSQLILILQAFHHFTYITAHSPTLPPLYLHHSSFSNPSIASPTSWLILQPLFCFSYITWLFTYVSWQAAHAVLTRVVCNPSLSTCHFGKCKFCPGPETLKKYLQELLETNNDQVSYKQWVSLDCTLLETVTKSSEEFTDSCFDKLESPKQQSFVASQQSSFQKSLKAEFQDNEFLVTTDFSENYSFVLQDEKKM